MSQPHPPHPAHPPHPLNGAHPLLTVTIQYERDVVSARQRARQVAMLLGFETQDQTKLATAVSEIARNAFAYAGGGKVEFTIEGRTPPQLLVVKISDSGTGVRDLTTILEGRYRSPTGMGVGLLGAKRLMDSFDIKSTPGGTTVWLRKLLPSKAGLIRPERVKEITTALAAQRPDDAFAEIRQQNQELLGTLDELRKRQDELARSNRELEDTNRGVVALYAELDERADHLRRADEVKTRFLSNMTHEFRTPVNSVLALSGLLLDGVDGPLNVEQLKQVGYIRKAANDLSELVNDLLDLAKVAAGKAPVRPSEFVATNLFGALRGMLRPLLVSQSLTLVFEEPEGIPGLNTDETKVSQILRNFISNALKFTERGEIRVRASYDEATDRVAFSVADTGIGIAKGDMAHIFEEFSQLDSHLQRRVKGTGLGLPLSKRLAELLGGSVNVESTPGMGSVFTLSVPRTYAGARVEEVADEPTVVQTGMMAVLAVEDQPEDRLVYDRLLRGTDFQLITAQSVARARDTLARVTPRAILLDLVLGNQDAWKFLAELKREAATAAIPVIVVTSIDDRAKASALGADSYAIKPLDRQWLVAELTRLVHRRTALVIDDDEAARYTLRQLLRRAGWETIEAQSGPEGLAKAASGHVRAIFLDLSMPGMNGLAALARLRNEPATVSTPVFVSSAAALSTEDRARIEGLGAQLLPKGLLGPAGVAAALRGLEARGAGAHTVDDRSVSES